VKGLRRKKKSAKFAMPSASQLVADQSSQNFCEIHDKQNVAIRSTPVPHNDIQFFANFIHTQHIAIFTLYRVSLQTLRSTTYRNLRFLAPRILRLNVYRKPHHIFLQNFPVVGVSQVAM
jgi:hypothetical protein